MNTVKVINPLIQKRTEGVQNYYFQCYQDEQPCMPDSKYKYVASFATEESPVRSIDMKTQGTMLMFSSDQLLDLPAGV